MELSVNQILVGDALEVLRTFPAGSINCCISSPPYWGLRDYGIDGQLGLEPTFEEYIDKLCTVYDEVFRVLRKDGTCWVNLGDTYFGSGQDKGKYGEFSQQIGKREVGIAPNIKNLPTQNPDNKVQNKSLCLVPQRFAIEMVNRGWILRNVLIWHKPNPMPSSAKDRFTVDFEQVFFFVKSKKYWFEPQYEPHHPDGRKATMHAGAAKYDNSENPFCAQPHERWANPLGRNKRCVWTIPTQPCPEAHFATFPNKLVEPMILAGCPEFVCKKCGKAREKIYSTKELNRSYWAKQGKTVADVRNVGKYGGRLESGELIDYKRKNHDIRLGPSPQHYFKGYTDCDCNAGFRSGIVCDPFLRNWNGWQSGRTVAA